MHGTLQIIQNALESIRFLFIIILVVFVACNSNEDDNPQTNEEVVNFINEVVDIMEANSINRNTIDWSDFRSQVLDRAASARNIAEAYEALRLALVLLEDNHSFILKQNGFIISGPNVNCQPLSLETVTTSYYPVGCGGHVDEFCCFVNDSTIMLAETTMEESNADSIALENHKRMEENYEALKNATDQDGNPFHIIRVPVAEISSYEMKYEDILPWYIDYYKGAKPGQTVKTIAA
jgi:hypothetical protein